MVKGLHLHCECSEVKPIEKRMETERESSCVIHTLLIPASIPPLLCPYLSLPPPCLHRCSLSATSPGKFPRARGSPLSVSSDTVIRSVGTESVPLSEPRTLTHNPPSFRCAPLLTPKKLQALTLPQHFLCHLSFLIPGNGMCPQ